MIADRIRAYLAGSIWGPEEARDLLREAADRLAAAERDIKAFGDPAYLAARLILADAVVEAARAECDTARSINPRLHDALASYEKAYSSEQEGSGQEMLALRPDPTDLNISEQSE